MKVRKYRDALVAEIRGLIEILGTEEYQSRIDDEQRQALQDVKSWRKLRSFRNTYLELFRAALLTQVEYDELPSLSRNDNVALAPLNTSSIRKD